MSTNLVDAIKNVTFRILLPMLGDNKTNQSDVMDLKRVIEAAYNGQEPVPTPTVSPKVTVTSESCRTTDSLVEAMFQKSAVFTSTPDADSIRFNPVLAMIVNGPNVIVRPLHNLNELKMLPDDIVCFSTWKGTQASSEVTRFTAGQYKEWVKKNPTNTVYTRPVYGYSYGR